MGVIGRLRLSFWVARSGTIVLYVFFVALATIPPGQVAALTVGSVPWRRSSRSGTCGWRLSSPTAGEILSCGGLVNRIRERRGF